MTEIHTIPCWAGFDDPAHSWLYGQYIVGGTILARDVTGWANILRTGGKDYVCAQDDSEVLYPVSL